MAASRPILCVITAQGTRRVRVLLSFVRFQITLRPPCHVQTNDFQLRAINRYVIVNDFRRYNNCSTPLCKAKCGHISGVRQVAWGTVLCGNNTTIRFYLRRVLFKLVGGFTLRGLIFMVRGPIFQLRNISRSN